MRRQTPIATRLLLVGVLALAPAAMASAETFENLQRDFQRLSEALAASRGYLESDKPAVEGLLERTEAFSAANPSHAGAIALQLQVNLWLMNEDAIGPLYEKLRDLRPDDPRVALSWLNYRVAISETPDDPALKAAARELARAFPSDPEIIEEWTRRQQRAMQYADVVRTVEAGEFSPVEAGGVIYNYADALFAEHRFEEALAAVESLQSEDVENPIARARAARDVGTYTQYIEHWKREQELRTAEAEADDLPRAEIITPKGRIVVELYENEAPNTVANFITLAESGFYDGTTFHRFEPNFMIQGGDPLSREGAEGDPGSGDPGYKIADEHGDENDRLHFSDSFGMAKQTAKNTGGCQFYLNHRPTPWLNGRHTVFGRILEGRDVVLELRADDEIKSVRILRKRDHPYVVEKIEAVVPVVEPPSSDEEAIDG